MDNPIIVALDGKNWAETLKIAESLRSTRCTLKVNDLLGERGYGLVKDLAPSPVMADPKWHDIPNTLENYAKRLASYSPWAVTVHASAHDKAIAAVVKAFADTPTKVLAITLLTSLDEVACQEIYFAKPLAQVKTFAAIAARVGVHGFVCSPQEATFLKEKYPAMELVIPGVRSPGNDPGDQARVDTPLNAIANGATRLVMGRQILNAPHPAGEVIRVLTEELGMQVPELTEA